MKIKILLFIPIFCILSLSRAFCFPYGHAIDIQANAGNPPLFQDSSAVKDSIFQSGKASYYGNEFHGSKTANGEIFDNNDFTCAHFSLPFNSIVKVINTKNNKSVIVRVNDRGPFVRKRVIDLSVAAAKKINMMDAGIAQVNLIHLPKILVFEQLDSLLNNVNRDTLFSITGRQDTVKGNCIKVWENSDMMHSLVMTAELLKETSGLRYYIKMVVNKSKKTKNRRFIILAKGDNESEYPEKISFFRSYGFSKADIIKIPK